jgi:aminocarboxymuconate-semialdehyde decarboxylase
VRIDLHTHVVPPRWEDFAARYGGGRWPRLEPKDACHATIMTGDQFFRAIDDRSWSPERRIEDMDRLGIDRQALSSPPIMLCYWAEPKAAQAFARMQNEFVAEVAARHPARFSGMASVPLQDVALAIEELRHCKERLSLRAVEIGTCPAGRDFDDPALFPFFQACRDLDVAIFVHPASPLVGQERLTQYYFPLIVGNPLETALAISKLISAGSWSGCPTCASASRTGAGRSRSRWPGSITAGTCGRKARRRFPRSRASTPGASSWTRSRSRRATFDSSSRSWAPIA